MNARSMKMFWWNMLKINFLCRNINPVIYIYLLVASKEAVIEVNNRVWWREFRKIHNKNIANKFMKLCQIKKLGKDTIK
jgi:hypothetical protein